MKQESNPALNNSVIYQDFAQAISRENHVLHHKGMTLLRPQGSGRFCKAPSLGRAYLEGQGVLKKALPYGTEVHFQPIGESYHEHLGNAHCLEKSRSKMNPVYMGTAGAVNLEYMGAIRASAAILYDINPIQTLFWQEVIKHLAAHDNAQDFAQALRHTGENFETSLTEMFNVKSGNFNKILVNGDRLNYSISSWKGFREVAPKSSINFLTSLSEVHQHRSWAHNPARYRHLHDMAKNNAIAALTIDLTDEIAGKKLREALCDAQYRPIRAHRPLDKTSLKTGAHVTIHQASNVLDFHCFSGCQMGTPKEAWENLVRWSAVRKEKTVLINEGEMSCPMRRPSSIDRFFPSPECKPAC